jgi:carbamoyltransferase
VNISYSGFGILDINKLPDYAERFKARPIFIRELARILCAGKIVGVMRGNSECGPRALGNRSILAWPGDASLKDRLNEKIKYRESYRPYAAVVRAEDAVVYFTPVPDSPFMSYSPLVDPYWRDSMPAIVHQDGTDRVQTVTKDQNPFLYELLSYVEVIKDIGILLNTSFNIKGKPILTTIEDAIEAWQTTDLDCLYIEGYLFEK